MKLLKYMLIMLLGCAAFVIPCILFVKMPESILLSVSWGVALVIVLGEYAVKEIKSEMRHNEEIREQEMVFNNLEILDILWYGKLGIIKARDKTTNEIKIYIGEGEGLDDQTDIYHIVSFGTKYTPESFGELIKWLEVDNDKNT